MKLEVRRFDRGSRWSEALPAGLDSEHTAVIAFAAPGFADDPAPLRDLRAAFPRAWLVGCSTAGEILQDRVHDDSVVAAIVRFDHATPRVVSTRVDDASKSAAAGGAIGEALGDPDLRAVVILSEGLQINGTQLLAGIRAAVRPGVAVTGGLAGDGTAFGRTWVWAGGDPLARSVVALGLYGDRVAVTHGSKGGWDIFGPERRITRSEGNVLYELDGKPALRLYKDYLGDRATGLPATALLFPLAIRTGPRSGEQLVRTVLSVDEASQSMTFAGDVPTGALAQLMRANFDRLVEGASGAASIARPGASDEGPVLSLAISCVGRRLVLGERTEDELEATLEVLPPTTRQVGFYSYGEISPHVSGTCELHNQTMTLTTISER